ncbi:MAG: tetratricopeptide repeat protein [Planctomycetota bacterium]
MQLESPRNTAKAARLTRQGIHALSKRKIDAAAKHFREAVDADFAYGPAHNNLGLLHYEQGNLYQAVLAFEHAHEFLPEDPAAAYNLALALESGGRVGEARQYYELASQMDPSNPNYLGNLVRLRVRLGERDLDLKSQLEDLVLIETRPHWRRWADIQLALDFNDALDRGPDTPDLESSTDEARKVDRSILRTKIIDLTPVTAASFQEPLPAPETDKRGEIDEAESSDDLLQLLPGGPDFTDTPSVVTDPMGEGLPDRPSEIQLPGEDAPELEDYFRSN